jgi:hypothetical protein
VTLTREQRDALIEISSKSIALIQAETARKWAHRAWAARELAITARDNGEELSAKQYEHDAVEYEHEAIEHAALTGSDDVLRDTRAIVAAGALSTMLSGM